jgi:predicted RNA methylase
MDKHYTADAIATRIVDLLPAHEARLVADFAAGDGSLLRALARRWPGAQMVASDIDPNAIRGLRRAFPGVRAHGLDFLDARSHQGRRLRRYRNAADIVFINPPFSCRGGTKFAAAIDGAAVKCSKAMAFLIETLRYRASAGIIVAILPASCLSSEKDREARGRLAEHFRLDVLGLLEPTDFARCSVQTVCVIMRPIAGATSHPLAAVRPAIAPVAFAARLSRGSIAVARSFPTSDYGFLLAHTTDLQGYRLRAATRKVPNPGECVQGPCVIFPRVGRVRRDKICVIPKGRKVLMSDCLIAVETALVSEASKLAEMLLANFDRYASIYTGTCAPYTTLSRVRDLLLDLGVALVVERPEERPSRPKAHEWGVHVGSRSFGSPTDFLSAPWPRLIEIGASL